MQYTSSSFAQMLVELFRGPLRPKVHAPRIEGPFARPARFHSEVPDVVLDGVVRPAAARAAVSLAWFRWVQQGSVHLYLLYVLAALVLALLVWR
jgi:hydrogenase-4 component B